MIFYKKQTYTVVNHLFQAHIELAGKIESHIDKSWLHLKMPKIIYIEKNKISNTVNNLSSSNSITEVGADELNLILNRNDKKSRNYGKPTDLLEHKKNKIKSKKKIKAQIHISDDDESINENQDSFDSLRVNQSLALSLLRPTKSNKKIHSLKNSHYKKSNVITKNNKKKEEATLSSPKQNEVVLTDPISVNNLSTALSVPAADIIKFLFMKGIFVTVNQVVDIRLAKSIAEEYGVLINKTTDSKEITQRYIYNEPEDKNQLLERAPVISIFGHVDHGKTTLLDTIRSTKTTSLEPGGITQKLEAYEVNIDKSPMIFLDTPGHEAFSSTRLLGIQVADIGVLVVAADDGLQPQSVEAIKYLQEFKIPFVVALNKMDKDTCDLTNITKSLANFEITNSQSGGNTDIITISALQNTNINLLLKAIANIARKNIFKANPNKLASGTILNVYLDKKKGPFADIIVQNGTLQVGDYITNANYASKIRTITNPKMKDVKSVGPSSVVKISGLSFIPQLGTLFQVLEKTKGGKKQIAGLQKSKASHVNLKHHKLNVRITLDTPSQKKRREKKVNIIVKTDSGGTIEALIQSLSNITQEKVQLNIVSISIGEVNASDITLASVSNSLILSFNVNVTSKMFALAFKKDVSIQNFQVIYDLIEYVEKEMLKYVDTDYDEQVIGCGTVENVFVVSKGSVAGCIVTEGKLKLNSYIRVYRNSELIHEGQLSSLRQIKEDVEEVYISNECGVFCNNFDSWHKKDVISAYELIEKIRTL